FRAVLMTASLAILGLTPMAVSQGVGSEIQRPFAVVIIGGLANPIGALGAGLLIGVSESVTMAVVAPAWAPLVSFSILIGLLVLRPGRA
ncbi:MAG TPA: efflux RND transporter permease subunit, partial [Planctomycetota bacterium]|nr:efflux RND transporter permease subunit [Planctomycetota bacterium]